MEIKGSGMQPGDGRNHTVYIEDISDEKIVLLPRVVFLCAFSGLEKCKQCFLFSCGLFLRQDHLESFFTVCPLQTVLFAHL